MTTLLSLLDPLRDWTAFAVWQSFFFLGPAVVFERFFRRRPWQAHLMQTLGIFASVLTPTVSLLIYRYGGGVVSPGSVWALEKQASGPASVLGPTILGGGMIFAILLLYGIASARRLMFHAKPFPDRESQEALLEGSRMMQNISLPILFTSPAVKSPTVWSWGLHPAVLLPESLSETLTPSERDAIFLHEMAHITRRDHWAALLARFCGIFLFWNPLYWFALKLADLSADRACDLLVLSREKVSPEIYSETLLRLAAGEKNRPVLQYLSRKEQLMKRIDTILDFEENKKAFSVSGTPLRIFGMALAVLFLVTTLAFCQEKQEDPAKEAEKPSYEKVAEDLVARFAKNNFSDDGFTQTMKDGQASDIAKALWDDFQKQFGPFVKAKTTKAESLLEFKRIHQQCEFQRGTAVLMVVVDKNDLIAGLFVMSAEKKTETPKNVLVPGSNDLPRIDKISMDKKISDVTDDSLSTPESAYASFARALANQDAATFNEGLKALSVPRLKLEGGKPVEPDWAAVLLSARIVRVHSFEDKKAIVIAKLDGENVRKPYDVRYFEKTDGKWLNAGNDRFDSPEEAEERFARMIKFETKKSTVESGIAPKVVKFEPPLEAKDVDPESVTEIRATFDRDMSQGGFSWCGGPPLFPETTDKPRWIDRRTCVLPVKLEEKRLYRLAINSNSAQNFKSADGVPAVITPYFFTTKGYVAEEPKIVKMEPENGAADVDADAVTELRVTFDIDMNTGGFSWCGGGETFPETTDKPRWIDKRTCILPVKLVPGKSYELSINARRFKNFRSAGGVPVEPVPYSFTTKNEDDPLPNVAEPEPEDEAKKTETKTPKARVVPFRLPKINEVDPKRAPRIVKMLPENGAKNVDPNISQVYLTFDLPMGGGRAWAQRSNETALDFDENDSVFWTEDQFTCVAPVTLKPNKKYEVMLNFKPFIGFVSIGGVPAGNVFYSFETGAGPLSPGTREKLAQKNFVKPNPQDAKRPWGPEQATGEPVSYRFANGGDYPTAWASLTEDDQEEWLELTWDEPVESVGVAVYETFNPGALVKVSTFDEEDNEVTLWEGSDPTPKKARKGKGVSQIRFEKTVKVTTLRLHLDSPKVPGWNAIDAVGLADATGKLHWATGATASSTYADRER